MKNFKRLLLTSLLCFLLTGCSNIPVNNSDVLNSNQENNIVPIGSSTIIEGDDLQIYILDVGQGSACLIKSGNSNMLIDAGENSCEELIVQYLNDLNVTKLEYVIGTHPDSDHVGGLDAVIKNFDVDTVFLSAIEDKDTKTCNDVETALAEKGMSYSTPTVGSTYTFGNASFIVLAPSNHYPDANDNSIAIKLTYGNFDFLTTGDCEKAAESDICALAYDITADVYNAGHHGSSNASSEELLDRVQPTAVTISCGKDNKYKHPHDITLKRFADRNINVYRTDELGTIKITSDGSTFNINGIILDATNNDLEPHPDFGVEIHDKEENIINEENVTKNNNETANYAVWITKTGAKYHREDCDSLSNSSIQTTLQEALEKGLEPCKKCNP